MDDGNPKEDGEQEEARGGGDAVGYIENANPKEDGERARRMLSFGNTYKIPKRQPTVCFTSQSFSYQLLGGSMMLMENFAEFYVDANAATELSIAWCGVRRYRNFSSLRFLFHHLAEPGGEGRTRYIEFDLLDFDDDGFNQVRTDSPAC